MTVSNASSAVPPPAIQVHGPDFYRDLAQRAAAAPRRRLNHNLHASQETPVHRIFNAIQPDSYVQPHCHLEPDKDETVVVLQGCMGLLEFDPDGRILARHVLGPTMTATIPAKVLHGWCCLKPDTVFFEAKAGPYAPLSDAERAIFAPREGSPDAPAALARLIALASGPDSPVGTFFAAP